MNNILKTLKALFFPERCPYCNRVVEKGKPACDTCIKKIPQKYFTNYAKGGYPCYSPFSYNSIFADAVKKFKFRNYPQNSEKLAVYLAKSITALNDKTKFDYITCVPMHPKKEHKRGYNQSKLLAKDTAKILGITYADLLQKVKNNQEQHKCESRKERSENVKGVYKAVNISKIKGKNILIIDDIITTGYTLGECCMIIEQSGGHIIRCATLCATNNK